MRSKFLLIALGSALAGCQTPGTPDNAAKGLPPVNVPVVTTADYVFDAAAPGGTLAPAEGDRLNGWFQGLGLGYGDTVYVDGGYAPTARAQVAAIAGRYGMIVTPGAPVTAGAVQTSSVRVVVARRRAPQRRRHSRRWSQLGRSLTRGPWPDYRRCPESGSPRGRIRER